jgi:hypothetical protein
MENGSGAPSCDPYQWTANRINEYALVAYIEGELGDFLYRLRQEIVPACRLRSHVSVLPPRPLCGTEQEAGVILRDGVPKHPAFEVALGEVEVFPGSSVIYVALERGAGRLQEMHDDLNAGPLRYTERYPYHPHITLAQEIPAADQARALELSLTRWREYTGPRTFPVESLVFVQNTGVRGWLDLSVSRLEMANSRR